jgi:hypothetical protein
LLPFLLAGYRAVLLRPKMQKAQGVTPDQLVAGLMDLALAGIPVDPEPDLTTERAPDPVISFPGTCQRSEPACGCWLATSVCSKTRSCGFGS